MPIPETKEPEKAAETVIAEPEVQVEDDKSAENDKVPEKVD
jgi:hypothetical protein